MPELIARLHALLRAVPDLRAAAPEAVVAVEVRDREWLARVVAGTVGGGQNSYVTLSNQAEGSAPLSVLELARVIRGLQP
ncbi:MAG: hypothetical protein IT481_01810 [Gammaproteobacteria bacterium]|nr:hypothetical protein [Gammaproteobacteria bacterium]